MNGHSKMRLDIYHFKNPRTSYNYKRMAHQASQHLLALYVLVRWKCNYGNLWYITITKSINTDAKLYLMYASVDGIIWLVNLYHQPN
jgi:hypothetical protein